jgi:hypothetical protein
MWKKYLTTKTTKNHEGRSKGVAGSPYAQGNSIQGAPVCSSSFCITLAGQAVIAVIAVNAALFYFSISIFD